jgi:hypothetical protein
MALPRLNDTPKYSLTIPSTGQKVKFRPYLVKEEKVLMIAFESQDTQQSLNAIVDTIGACLDPEANVNLERLTTFDVEYMFLQIRAKSAGEVARVYITCPNEFPDDILREMHKCGASNEIEIDLETITVEVPEGKGIIELTDDISVQMQYPSYRSVIATVDEEGNQSVEDGFRTLSNSIDAVLTGEQRMSFKDETEEEIQAFIDSLSERQLKKLVDFVDEMPELKKVVDYTCKKCSHKGKIELKGIQDFF